MKAPPSRAGIPDPCLPEPMQLDLLTFSRFSDDPRGGFVYALVAMFMSHVEIKLNPEPFDAFC